MQIRVKINNIYHNGELKFFSKHAELEESLVSVRLNSYIGEKPILASYRLSEVHPDDIQKVKEFIGEL